MAGNTAEFVKAMQPWILDPVPTLATQATRPPIPYGMSGVIPRAMGGNPALPNLTGLTFGSASAGVPPIPYGMGGVIPRALGGSPTLPDISGFRYAAPAVPASPNLGMMNGFAPPSPTGPYSRMPSVTPVSIRPGTGPVNVGGALSMADDIVPASRGGLFRGGINLPVGKMGWAKAGATGVGLQIAGNTLGNMAGGDDSAIGRFFKGAGTGAGVGAIGGVPTAVGAALVAGTVNALFGGKEDDGPSVWMKDETLSRAGFDEVEKTQIQTAYEILKETEGEDEAKKQIGAIIMDSIMMKQQNRELERQSNARMLATQQLAAEYFQPFTQQMMDSAQQRYNATEAVAADLPPAYRAVARSQNAASLDNATKVASAYATQAQIIPQMATMDYQMSLANQLSQQQAAQVMQQLMGGGQAGAGSLTELSRQAALETQP